MALGLTAKDHSMNWENELQDMKKSTYSSTKNPSSSTTGADDEDNTVPIADDEKETFTGKVVRKLTGGRSLKRNKSKNNKEKRLLSDSSYLGHHGDADHDDQEPEPPLPKEQLSNLHRKEDSLASFGHAQNRINNDDITSTNDFIGGGKNNNNHNNRYSQNDDLNDLDEAVPYTKF